MKTAFAFAFVLLGATFFARHATGLTEDAAAVEPEAAAADSADHDAPEPWSVIGDWRVTNPDWNFAPNNTDVLTLHEDGTHSVAHGSTGRWILTAEKGTPVLVLRWDRFGTESMSMIALDHFRGQKRPNRFIEMHRVTEE